MNDDTCTECGRTIPPGARRYKHGDRVLCYWCASQEVDEVPEESSSDLAAARDEQAVLRSTR